MEWSDSVLTEDDIRMILLEGYGLHAETMNLLGAELATVCRVESGTSAVAFKALPVGSLAEAEAEAFRWQGRVVDRLYAQGLPVAAPVSDLSGDVTHEATVRGTPMVIQVSQWLTGRPLAEIDPTPDALREVGRFAARLSLALGDAEEPPAGIAHAWEVVRSGESIAECLPAVADAEISSLLAATRESFLEALALYGPSLPTGIVHQDLHDANVLVEEGESARVTVTGVLDFGDMVRGPRIAEIVLAAVYAARNVEDVVEAFATVVSGWRELIEVTPAEQLFLLPAAAARLAVNMSVWESRFGTDRAGYAHERVAGSLRALRALRETDPAVMWELTHPVPAG